MRIDLYTKTVLTLIALALLVMAGNSFLRPSPVSADNGIGGAHFLAAGEGVWAIDSRTGDIWQYPQYPYGTGAPAHIGKISQLGQPIQ
jgi:hypothetical protein